MSFPKIFFQFCVPRALLAFGPSDISWKYLGSQSRFTFFLTTKIISMVILPFERLCICSLWTLSICFDEPFHHLAKSLLLELQTHRLYGSQPPLPPVLGCLSGVFTSSCTSPWLLKAFHPLSKVTGWSCVTISDTRASSDFMVPKNSATHYFRSSNLLS